MAELPDKKTSAVNARLTASLRARLDEIHRRYGPSDATMMADALQALADYVEHEKAYRRPMKMVFDEVAEEMARVRAAEAASAYQAGLNPKALEMATTAELEAELRKRHKHASPSPLPANHPAAHSPSPATDAARAKNREEAARLAAEPAKRLPSGRR